MSGELCLDNALESAVSRAFGTGEIPRVLCIGSDDVLDDAAVRFPSFDILTSTAQVEPASLSGIVATIDNAESREAWERWRDFVRVANPAAMRFVDISFIGAQLEEAQSDGTAPSLHGRLLPRGRLLYFDVAPLTVPSEGFALRTVESTPGLGLPNRRKDLIARGLLPSVERALKVVEGEARAVLAVQFLSLALGAGVSPSYRTFVEAAHSGAEESAVRASRELQRERDRYVAAMGELQYSWEQKVQELRKRELEALEVAESGVRLADDLLEAVTALNDSKAWKTTQRIRQLAPRAGGGDSLAELGAYARTARGDLEKTLARLRSKTSPVDLIPRKPEGPLAQASSDPVFPQSRHFVQLSPIAWRTSLFQRPQHMAVAMARQSIPATYSTQFVTDVDSAIINTSPFPGVRIAALDEAVGASNRGLTYSFYSTDLTVSWDTLQELRRIGNTLIYEYIDEISEDISILASDLRFRHKYLVSPASVDLVVTSAQALYEEMLKRFPSNRVVLVPNGVDQHHYWSGPNTVRGWGSFIRKVPEATPDDTVVGYFGAIAPWLDGQLIREVAQELPDYRFAFVGPDYNGLSAQLLPLDLPNVHWCGAIDYQDLASFARVFSTAWIPFQRGDIARTTSPLKLFEYLALGVVPVAPSWMPECVAIDLVQHGADSRSLAQALRTAIAMRADEAVASKLNDLALENSWDQRAASIARALERLGLWPMGYDGANDEFGVGISLTDRQVFSRDNN